ncbi:hypothetical protein [Sphingomonas bacterium]|uniref:hypothetical protein n=1 Tax=Sphingomonas bacterium TaxID=1895847 RepID=UPI00157697D7|nr:hypothetical protein [Sphingomonas bacterium]
MGETTPARHIEPGDRVVFLGKCGPRGKHGDVLSARRVCSAVSFDAAGPMLCLSDDLHRIPRRPKPDF